MADRKLAPLPPDFLKFISARFFFTFATQMQAVVLGWRVYELMKDPLYLGLIGLAEAVPAIGLALYAGFLVDRARPLMVYRRVTYVSLVSGLVVLAEHIFQSDIDISTQVGMLYGAACLTGLARSFAAPSFFAIVPRLVDRGTVLRATAASSSLSQIARIAGPACGGLVFGFFGAIVSSTIVCVCLVIAGAATIAIRKDIPAPDTQPGNISIRDEFLSGLKFVWKHPLLLPALSLDMISVLFGGVTALLPIYANEILFVGPKGLGILRAAPAIGATCMSLWLSRTNGMRTGRWLLSSVVGFGSCILLFGLSQNFYLSVLALAGSGVFDSVSMVIRSSVVQLSSPDHMRGKISAVNSMFIGSSNEIGELESGLAAKLLGTAPAVYFGGMMCLMTVAVIGYFSPRLREMDLNELATNGAVR